MLVVQALAGAEAVQQVRGLGRCRGGRRHRCHGGTASAAIAAAATSRLRPRPRRDVGGLGFGRGDRGIDWRRQARPRLASTATSSATASSATSTRRRPRRPSTASAATASTASAVASSSATSTRSHPRRPRRAPPGAPRHRPRSMSSPASRRGRRPSIGAGPSVGQASIDAASGVSVARSPRCRSRCRWRSQADDGADQVRERGGQDLVAEVRRARQAAALGLVPAVARTCTGGTSCRS